MCDTNIPHHRSVGFSRRGSTDSFTTAVMVPDGAGHGDTDGVELRSISAHASTAPNGIVSSTGGGAPRARDTSRAYDAAEHRFDDVLLLPPLHIPPVGYGPLLPLSFVSLAVGLLVVVFLLISLASDGWGGALRGFGVIVHATCWVTAGIIGLVMAESSTVTLDFPRRELTVRRYRALLAMCCAVGRTTVPFSSFVAVELRPACCGGAPWRAAQEVFLVADHPLEGRREVAVVAKVPADEAEEELKRWKSFFTDVSMASTRV